jgi:hypothetical protein
LTELFYALTASLILVGRKSIVKLEDDLYWNFCLGFVDMIDIKINKK